MGSSLVEAGQTLLIVNAMTHFFSRFSSTPTFAPLHAPSLLSELAFWFPGVTPGVGWLDKRSGVLYNFFLFSLRSEV
jgi:hypothetical protein